MTKPWIASAPQVQARVEPADDGSDQHRVSVTVSFAVSSAEPGAARPAGAHWHGPLRMALDAWWEQSVTPPVVRVPHVVGDSQAGAHEALRQAGLVPSDMPYLLPTEPADPVTGAVLAVEVRVVRQAPTGGAYAPPGSIVELEYEAVGTLSEHPERVDQDWVDSRPPCDLISCEWTPLRVELEFVEGR